MMDGPAAEPSRVKVSLGRGGCGWKGKLERILGQKTSWEGVWSMVGGQERWEGFLVCLFAFAIYKYFKISLKDKNCF